MKWIYYWKTRGSNSTQTLQRWTHYISITIGKWSNSQQLWIAMVLTKAKKVLKLTKPQFQVLQSSPRIKFSPHHLHNRTWWFQKWISMGLKLCHHLRRWLIQFHLAECHLHQEWVVCHLQLEILIRNRLYRELRRISMIYSWDSLAPLELGMTSNYS